jgi:phosphatidate phosphatase APP1
MVAPIQHSSISTSSSSLLKKWGHALLQRFKINTSPVIKVYHGFGTKQHMSVFGHVLLFSPRRQEKFSSRFWKNTLSLLRLFMIKPMIGVKVQLTWGTQTIEVITNETGFFHFSWIPEGMVNEGWHRVAVQLISFSTIPVIGYGKLFVPHQGNYAVVSDIDDTFLVSYSSDLLKRLYVLLTSNARTRKPFDGVVKHYQLLAQGDNDHVSRPFFYVSSSEWNLYDYIREFSTQYQLPEGVYLLSRIKQLHEFWKTGKGKHRIKYFRIARLLLTYPDKQFILLGDDSQEDPSIYHQLVIDFPGRIVCVYLRHVRSERLKPTRVFEAAIKKAGVEICYFTHSDTAIAHSKKIGLID